MSKMKRERGSYSSKEYTAEQKIVIAGFSRSFREDGMKWSEVAERCEKAGFPVPEATLRDWMARLNEGMTPISAEKGSGRPRSLDDDTVAVIIGWFLQCEDDGEKTTQLDFLFIAFNNFQSTISQSTVSRLLAENWLTLKLFGRRSVAGALPREETSQRYYEELLKLDQEGVWAYDRNQIWCMDVTTDSRRYELPKSWGRGGGDQRKLRAQVPLHTTSFGTLVNAAGFQRGPYIFTRNKEFLHDSPEWPAVVAFCKQHKLDSDEIIVELDGNSKYYKEDCYMMDHILHVSKPWAGHVFLTDKGTAFVPKGESVILDNGADKHYVFDPPIHGKISINDGHIHPFAKRQWLSMRKDDDPEWKQVLQLAYCVSTVPVDSTKRAWDRNFFLNKPKTLVAVDDMLWGRGKGTNKERENRFVHCLKAYKEFVANGGVIDRYCPPEVDPELQHNLDGAYWQDE